MQVTLKNLHTNIVKFVEDNNDLSDLVGYLDELYDKSFRCILLSCDYPCFTLKVGDSEYHIENLHGGKYMEVYTIYKQTDDHVCFLVCDHNGTQYFRSFGVYYDYVAANKFLGNSGKTIDELSESDLEMLNFLMELK